MNPNKKEAEKMKVSIPFKRESVSKVIYANSETVKLLEKFQFPSNGKAYPKTVYRLEKEKEVEFQFPSNGKAYPKLEDPAKLEAAAKAQHPFQFPSNGKAYPKKSNFRN